MGVLSDRCGPCSGRYVGHGFSVSVVCRGDNGSLLQDARDATGTPGAGSHGDRLLPRRLVRQPLTRLVRYAAAYLFRRLCAGVASLLRPA